jgi:purine-binding chemotaxis protein CheW
MQVDVSPTNDTSLVAKQVGETEAMRYLTFRVDGTVYGVSLSAVKEVVEYGALTQVPLAPAFVRGVFNLRGSVLPVIDLAVRLGKQAQAPNERSCFILTELEDEGETLEVGFLVDAVEKVAQIPDHQIEAAPTFGVDVRPDFIAGMGKQGDGFVILLDIDQVLSINELSEAMRSGSDQLRAGGGLAWLGS